jgi:putative membrane protein
MKILNLFGLLLAGACTLQACHSPESRAVATTDSSSKSSGKTDSALTDSSSSAGTPSVTAGKPTQPVSGKMTAENKKLESNNTPIPEKDNKSTNATHESHVDSDEAAFMKQAAIGGMMEVDLGNIALKSTNPAVKAFAVQMVADHSKANVELKALADKSGILLPTTYPSEEKQHMDEMKKMKGGAFDKHYIDMMVTDHDKTVTLFRNGVDSQDKDVKAFAVKTLPVITSHFRKAKAIQATLK